MPICNLKIQDHARSPVDIIEHFAYLGVLPNMIHLAVPRGVDLSGVDLAVPRGVLFGEHALPARHRLVRLGLLLHAHLATPTQCRLGQTVLEHPLDKLSTKDWATVECLSQCFGIKPVSQTISVE